MVLKNMMLHIQMKKEVAKMSERFPGIDWYCDRCNAYLNDQPGFDDHHYVCNADISSKWDRNS